MSELVAAVPAEPTRQVWHFALLIPVIFTLIASHLLDTRPLMAGGFNNVVLVGPAPAAIVPPYVGDWDVLVHRSDWSAPVARLLGHDRAGRRPRLGWVVREWNVLTLPVVGWRQSGVAVVTEDGYGYRVNLLTADAERRLDVLGGPGGLPWWRMGWGWPVYALFAAFVWAELRWQARRRAILGIL